MQPILERAGPWGSEIETPAGIRKNYSEYRLAGVHPDDCDIPTLAGQTG